LLVDPDEMRMTLLMHVPTDDRLVPLTIPGETIQRLSDITLRN